MAWVRSRPSPRLRGAEFVAVVADHLAGTGRSGDDLVFVDRDGGPVRRSNFYRRTFKPAVDASGADDRCRFHDLRHTCAACLIAEGALCPRGTVVDISTAAEN